MEQRATLNINGKNPLWIPRLELSFQVAVAEKRSWLTERSSRNLWWRDREREGKLILGAVTTDGAVHCVMKREKSCGQCLHPHFKGVEWMGTSKVVH